MKLQAISIQIGLLSSVFYLFLSIMNKITFNQKIEWAFEFAWALLILLLTCVWVEFLERRKKTLEEKKKLENHE